jgi:hypothetical protein
VAPLPQHMMRCFESVGWHEYADIKEQECALVLRPEDILRNRAEDVGVTKCPVPFLFFIYNDHKVSVRHTRYLCCVK